MLFLFLLLQSLYGSFFLDLKRKSFWSGSGVLNIEYGDSDTHESYCTSIVCEDLIENVQSVAVQSLTLRWVCLSVTLCD